MFATWMKEHDFKDFPLQRRLFPKASDRAYWQQILGQEQITAAEGCLGCDWPMIRATSYMAFVQTGDRLAHENAHFARRHQMITLFLGELAEGKGRFLPDICDGIFAICEESYWGVSAHRIFTKKHSMLPDTSDPYIDLFAAETAELIAIIYHILFDQLDAFCPGMVERMEYELDRRIVTAYLNHGDFWWMGKTKTENVVNNWNPWILSNILTVLLVTDQRPSRIQTGLKRMFEEVQRYYDIIPADGGCDEGCVYWTKAAAKLLMLCEQLYVASGGKLNLYGDEKLQRMGLYEEKVYIDGVRFVSFADSSARIVDIQPDAELYLFGLRTGCESLCLLAGTIKRNRGKVNLHRGVSIKAKLYELIYARDIDSQPPFQPENSYVLPDLQLSCQRSDSWYYAAKGGHNKESHNHNDVGNVIVYHQNNPVLIDSGSGVYNGLTFSDLRYTIWNMRSDWHNLPTVNGCVQAPGRSFAADRFCVKEQTTQISYAGAYPAEAGLQEAVRQIDISEAGVTLRDALHFQKKQNTVQLHYLTTLQPECTADGVVLGGRYLLKTPGSCQVEWKDFEGDDLFFTSWQTQGVYRLTVTVDCGQNVQLQTEIRSI